VKRFKGLEYLKLFLFIQTDSIIESRIYSWLKLDAINTLKKFAIVNNLFFIIMFFDSDCWIFIEHSYSFLDISSLFI
jgi:hypothetical protein